MPPTPRSAKPPQSPSRPFTPLLLITLIIPLFALLFPYSSFLSPSSDTARISSLISTKANDGPYKALLLTAHPDDEVMFFSPTILSLIKEGWEVGGLCLSTGNSSGLGEIRTEELYSSYEVLGVDRNRVEVIDHPKLQDSMTAQWDIQIIADIVEKHLKHNPVDLIITFDGKGISNHPNHIALSKSIPLLKTSPSQIPKVLYLKSPAVFPKFTGPFYPIYLNLKSIVSQISASHMLEGSDDEENEVYNLISTTSEWYISIQAMMYHKSQLVWFRWLYLAASRLMWVNELVPISIKESELLTLGTPIQMIPFNKHPRKGLEIVEAFTAVGFPVGNDGKGCGWKGSNTVPT